MLVRAVVDLGLSYGQVAARYRVSKTLVHRLHHRWLVEGEAAFTPRSSRPRSSPARIDEATRARVVQLRDELTGAGLDAGADTIHHLLTAQGASISRSSVWRILTSNHRILAQPHKRPRSSYIRFAAEQPNGCWQSDFTHWRLTGGLEVEIIGWLDDHSRFLLHLSAHRRVTGRTVTSTFTSAAAQHGWPAATLTDNGNVYTTRYAGGPAGRGHANAFETLLAIEGITQKNGRPYKPTTQGKIERLWQTLKKYLAAHPAATIGQLQGVLDAFAEHYNHHRPHRALHRLTPAVAYTRIPKATPARPDDPDLWRVRYDTVDASGKISLRWANRMLHLAIGRTHAGTPVNLLLHGLDTTAIDIDGVILAEHHINPERTYQPQRKTAEPPKPRVQPFTMS